MLSVFRQYKLNLLTIGGRKHNLLLLYGAQIFAVLAGLLYSKSIAKFFEPNQFGLYSVQLATMTLVYSTFVAPLVQSFKATIHNYSASILIQFYTVMFGCIYGVLGLGVVSLIGLDILPVVALLAWVGALLQGLSAFGNDYLNLTASHKPYAFVQALTPVINFTLLIALIVIWSNKTATALWVNYCLLYAILGVLSINYASRVNRAFIPAFRWDNIKIQPDLWHQYRSYALPLMAYALVGWIINYADRYLITYLMGSEEVGYYTIGYSLGARMALLATPLTAHLTPIIVDLKQQNHVKRKIHIVTRQYLTYFWILAIPTCWVLFAFPDYIGGLFLSDLYTPSFMVIPIIALAYIFSLSIQFLEIKFYIYGYTNYILYHNIIGAIVNILLNLYMIPAYGFIGAGWAMATSCCVQFAMAWFLFKKTDK